MWEGRGKRGGRLHCLISADDDAGIAFALDIDGRLMPLPAQHFLLHLGRRQPAVAATPTPALLNQLEK